MRVISGVLSVEVMKGGCDAFIPKSVIFTWPSSSRRTSTHTAQGRGERDRPNDATERVGWVLMGDSLV